MLRTLKIGKYIFERIHNITGYTCYPCSRITPKTTDIKVSYPYIVYNRTGLASSLTKDGYTDDNVSFEISIYSDDYEESIDVADAVRSALEVMSTTYDKILQIDNSMITNSNEQFIDNAYVQNIQWTADITRYVEHELKPTVESIKFGIHKKYSYESISGTGDWELDLNTYLDTGRKYVRYVTSSVDPYTVPITIWQNNYDVTDECTFSFPSGRNVSMEYNDHQLTFRLLSLQNTYFTTNIEITKDDQTIEIPFDINYVGTALQLLPQMNESSIFDYISYDSGRIFGKAVGTDNITSNGLRPPVQIDIESDAQWPISFGSVKVNALGPSYDNLITTDLFTISKADAYYINITPIAERPCTVGEFDFPRDSSTIMITASGDYANDITWEIVDDATYIKHRLCMYNAIQINISSYATNADPNIYIRSRFTNSTFEQTEEAYEAYKQRWATQKIGRLGGTDYTFNDVEVKTNIDGDPCYEIIVKPRYTFVSTYDYYMNTFSYYMGKGWINSSNWYVETSILSMTE